MAQTHEYNVHVDWQGGREGKGELTLSQSGVSSPIAVPPEFQGPGGGASPEELLAGAVASCYSITFGIIAANRNLPIKDVKADVTGQVEQNGAQLTYTAITIRPTITVDASAGEAELKLVDEMAHKADLYCIITNAVRGKVNITVEPNIVKG